jgi:type IV pilus assembly protein PilW
MHADRRLAAARQAGFSLIELMISMVIGLVVIGAMFAAYVGSGLSSRNTRAMSQITEDASIALSVLRSAIATTSYIVATDSDKDGFINVLGWNGRDGSLSGCNNTFSDPGADMDALGCTEGEGPHAIAVDYQADAQNSAVSAAGVPLDCLGNEVPDVGGVRRAYQRFFIDGDALHCRGPGNEESQALVDNVIDMRIQYGVACTPDGGISPCTAVEQQGRVVRYMDAEAIRDANPALFQWALSVRVCVTIASEGNVLDSATQYTDCNGDRSDPPDGDSDRRMIRSFTTTITLPNRLEGHL